MRRARSPRRARIGFLWTSNIEAQYLEAFRMGLRDLGHVEGRNVLLEQRSAAGSVPNLDALAQELIGTGVDLVVTQGTPAARAAAKATSKIPIVVALGEPLSARLVTGFSRPGGNVTGLTVLASELNAKRLELLKEMNPKASRLAVLFDPTATNADGAPLSRTKELETAARSLGVRLTVLPVKGLEEFSKAFAAAAEARVDAVLLSPSPVLSFHNTQLVDLAARHRLPAVYGNPESVKLGGLMSYGPSYTALFRARRDLRRQDPQGREPGRAADRAAGQVSNWRSTSRPRRRLESRYRARSCCAPTTSSNS